MKKSQTIILLFLGSLCFVPQLSAQEKLVDSLTTILKQTGISVHERAATLGRLAEVYSYYHIKKAQKTNQEAIQLVEKSTDADASTYIWAVQALLNVRSNKDSLAIMAADRALQYAKAAFPVMRGYALSKKAYVLSTMNQNGQAIKLWQKALEDLETPKGAYYQAGIYYQLYGVYAERKDHKSAKRYAQLALKRAQESGNYNMLAASWQIIGGVHLDAFWATQERQQLDSAITAYHHSLKVYHAHKAMMKYPPVVVLSALNLANIYSEYFPSSYIDSVETNLDLALHISKKSNAKEPLINTYQAISRLYAKADDLDNAKKFLEKAKTIADSLDPVNYYARKNIYHLLAQVNEKQGDFKQALVDQKAFFNDYKHIFDQEQNRTIQQLKIKYQAEKKQEAILRLQQQNEFQKHQTRLYYTIGIIVIILLLALFIAYRYKLKYAREREATKAEEASRLQAEQKLIESQKENLQKELMAGALQLEHKNELLYNLKKRLTGENSQQSSKELDRILKNELRIDGNFEDIRKELNELHPEFFNRLQEKAHHKLTQLDLKYCAYFYMKLSTKQIAELMHVAPKSVRMTKYRLKQKLDLNKGEDLIDFLLDKGKD